ncbi:MAG: dNTP triphosphohydrolase, partial [Bryobacteraceae bacterium]|nr:dNTP triphosphohydrolase [Bryobacteraceae bacterium]
AGEVAIQQWFHADRNKSIVDSLRSDAEHGNARYAQDFLAFDGNAQTVRLITKLQVLADEFGLNLTCGTLAAATKYIATSDNISDAPHQMSKLGVFASEADLIQEVRAEVGLEGYARHPVTFVVEACDDIVYSSVDLEDGIKKGVISWDQLVDELTAEVGDSSPILTAVKNRVSRQLGCHKPVDHIDQDAFAQAFRIQSIGRVVPAVRAVFGRRFNEIDMGTYGGELLADDECEAKAYVEACKKIARKSVYACKDVLRLELMGRKIIHDLMDVFWEGARIGSVKAKAKDYPGKSYRLISSNYRHVFEQQLAESKGAEAETYHRLQLVVDYVAGMTDTFARELHRRLSNG